jgi:citronellol/citronellal dehydrogenase
MTLKDRVAIITGSSRGIGRDIALALAREGCHIVVTGKTTEPHPKLPGTIYTVAEEVEALGVKALPLQLDVRDVDSLEAMAQKTRETFGRIDILINNAGALWWEPLLKTPAKRFDLMMDVNARGAFYACHAVLPTMIEGGWGHIINMSPPIDLDHVPHRIGYMISKYGMTLLTHGLAEEMRPHNIGVNSLWPVTLIESLATENWGLGDKSIWRKASIMSDSVLEIVRNEPLLRTGKALLDEPLLREAGVTDFEQYNCVPGATPPELNAMWEKTVQP